MILQKVLLVGLVTLLTLTIFVFAAPRVTHTLTRFLPPTLVQR